MTNGTVTGYLQSALKTHPDSEFLTQGDESVTFSQLDKISDRVAMHFLNCGLKKGDKVGIIALNQLEWLYTFFAAAKIGVVIVALSPRYRDQELEYMINHSDMKMLVCIGQAGDFNYVEYFREFKARIPNVTSFIYIGGEGEHSFNSLLQTEPQASSLSLAQENVSPADHLFMLYTSGTTGTPKGVLITNASILASACAQVDHFQITESDSAIGALPLNHVGGITCTIMVALISKSSVFLIPSFHPDIVLETIQSKRATILGGVPTMYLMLLSNVKPESVDLSSVKLVIAGGSNVEKSLFLMIERFFPKANVVNLYGLSESSGACVLSRLSDESATVQTTIGVPIGNFKAKVIGADGKDSAINDVGELLLKGDCIAAGYYKSEEETRSTFRNNWLHTGDMVAINEQGYVSYKGRKKEMYISGGFNVSPTEIENVLTSHEKVQMAAGIGVPDELMGEVGVYYIVPKHNAEVTSQELMGFCKQNLSDYKIPKQFIFVTEVPVTPAGKIQKSVLKQRYMEEGVDSATS